MPVTYSIKSHLLLMEASDEYPASELPRTFLAALSDPACPAQVALLLDVRQSRSLAKRTADEIRAVSVFLGPHARRIGGRCAVVVGSEVQFGLGRMGSVHAEAVGVKAEIFRDLEPGLEWLGIPGSGAER